MAHLSPYLDDDVVGQTHVYFADYTLPESVMVLALNRRGASPSTPMITMTLLGTAMIVGDSISQDAGDCT